ncbi:hypothetical protein SAMN05428964_105204 [Thalassospira xiamenensis]|uniref:Uncharacterized protein n=2 Tax=Thalassospira xiamenensis TaxID=220697 RepID=A0A285TSN5_9PROT|nr:hypothetical protein SAMN05428964_105204 [Thalassospira xiamenensis]
MGSGRWDSDAWASYTRSHVAGRSKSEVFSSRSMSDDFDPKNIKLRESRDSDDNPNATPIIIGGDVTGSMGSLAHEFMRGRLHTMATDVYDRKPVTDPHIMFMAIGDADHDSAPLQVTQWEADIRIAEQLQKIYLEQGGGANSYESYHLPWYFAATRTSMDSFEKRGKKGVLFTYGDELPPPKLTKAQVSKVFGDTLQEDLETEQVLQMAERTFDVYHFVLTNVGQARGRRDTMDEWLKVMGERAVPISDDTKLTEVMISILELRAGRDKDDVVNSWSGDTSLVVADAIKSLTSHTDAGSTGGPIAL